MKFIPNAVTSKAARQILVAQKHSPRIMFAAGVVGVVATTVMASKATLKLTDIFEEAEKDLADGQRLIDTKHKDYSAEDFEKDSRHIQVRTAVKIAKNYAPAVALGVLSITLLTGSHVVLTRRNVALTASYVTVEKAFNEYRERVLADVGREKELVEKVGDKEVRTVVKVPGEPSMYARWFDKSASLNWQPTHDYNLMFLRANQKYLNDKLQSRGHVFLNDVFDGLGMERTVEGSVVGWVKDGAGDGYIDFGIFDGDDNWVVKTDKTREGSILLDFNVDGVVYDQI